MDALRRVIADPLAYGEPDAADLLAMRSRQDRTEGSQFADAMAVSLKSALDRTVRPLARTALGLVAERCWIPFGYARLEDYARERLGRTGRWVRDLAALGRAVEQMHGLAVALVGDDGQKPIGRVAALFIGKVATSESLPDWIALARSTTARELKEWARRARKQESAWPVSAGHAASALKDEVKVGSKTSEADGDSRCRVRVPTPTPVRAAFDESAVLHRAVCGSESSIPSFADALVAEACAGACPPDVDVAAPATGDAVAERERRLAERHQQWQRLDRVVKHFPLLAVAESCLRRLEELDVAAGYGGPPELDEQIRSLIAVEDEMEKALARLLLEMSDRRAWHELGFTGVGHYAEERLRLSRSSATDRVRLVRALRRHGALRDAYESGTVTAEAARLVACALGPGRASADVERRWIERAEGATVKRLRDELRALRRSRAMGVGRATCEPLDDGDWHASLRQAPGVFRERVRMLGARAVNEPAADSCLNLRLPDELAGRFLAAIEGSRATLAARVAAESRSELGCETDAPPSLQAARMFSAQRLPIPAWVGLLAMLEDFVDTWDDPEAHPKRRSDAVYVRDGWRCSAPGCTSRRNLEDHHIDYRSRGGGNELTNRTCTCRFHHQMGEHGMYAACRGQAPLDIEWRIGWFRITRFSNERWIGGERIRESSRLTPEESALLMRHPRRAPGQEAEQPDRSRFASARARRGGK